MMTLLQDGYEKDQGYFEALTGGQVVLSAGEIPGSIQIQALLRFADEVELSPQDTAELREQDVAVGLDRITGETVIIDIARTFHFARRWCEQVGKIGAPQPARVAAVDEAQRVAFLRGSNGPNSCHNAMVAAATIAPMNEPVDQERAGICSWADTLHQAMPAHFTADRIDHPLADRQSEIHLVSCSPRTTTLGKLLNVVSNGSETRPQVVGDLVKIGRRAHRMPPVSSRWQRMALSSR